MYNSMDDLKVGELPVPHVDDMMSYINGVMNGGIIDGKHNDYVQQAITITATVCNIFTRVVHILYDPVDA